MCSWPWARPRSSPPAAIIDKLNQEINAIPAEAKMKSRLGDLGGTSLAASPADFGKLLTDREMAQVIKLACIKSE